uniref:Zinc finger Ran-binding domain-containing protein 2-like n=1 Tax=Tanacetum cinerariifolium TaxID=118510 RepID=A0A6L2MUJ1_TANCI|nr:zinc finger Ran-binding domain-containing protein 2-like [Tanacetum cinerariifolium]
MSSGDWMCGACQHSNFKKRDVCQICVMDITLQVKWNAINVNHQGNRKVVLKVDDVSLVDGFFDDAFSREGESDVVMGEGVVVTSSSLEMLTNSCLGRIMVSLIFLEELEEEA